MLLKTNIEAEPCKSLEAAALSYGFVDQDQKSRPGFPLREWFDRTTILQEDDKFDLMTRGMTSQPSQAMDEFVSEDRVELLSQHYLHVDDVDLFVGGRLERLIPGTLAGITFQCIMGEQFFRWKFGDRWFYDFKENPASFTLAQLSQLRTRLDVLHPDRQTTGFAALPQDTENIAIPLQRPLLPPPAREDHEQKPVEYPELQVQQPVVLVDNTEQLHQMKLSTMSRVICDNGDHITSMQPRAFLRPSDSNSVVACDSSSIPALDFSSWKEAI
uniref:Peroxidase n=1 Tax=Timema genevievae TaxID=629358 RepID=A0A7R9K5J9_TIMGE|nr:unnamed protein product [Timema genevievae]